MDPKEIAEKLRTAWWSVWRTLQGEPYAGYRRRLRAFWRKYVARFMREKGWIVLLVSWILALFLGIWGCGRQFHAMGETRSICDALYGTMQLFVMEDNALVSTYPLPWQLWIARFLAPMVAASTAITALGALLQEKFQLLDLKRKNNHVVVCGIGEKGLQVAESFCESGEQVVIVESEADNESLNKCRDLGIIVLIGDATDKDVLEKARVHHARTVIAICGDDGANVEIGIHTAQLYRKEHSSPDKGPTCTCLVHVVDPSLRELHRESKTFPPQGGPFEIRFFNIYRNGARALLEEFPPDENMVPTAAATFHIAIIGFGRLGENVFLQATSMGQHAYDAKPHITVIDRMAKQREGLLLVKYPQLKKVCEPTFLELDTEDAAFYKGSFLKDRDKGPPVTAVYVCLGSDSDGLSAALRLAPHLQDTEVPVVICMREEFGLACLVREESGDGVLSKNVQAMGITAKTCTREMILNENIDLQAMEMHRDYVKRREQGESPPEVDPALFPWEQLEESLRESNRQQADHIPVKLRAIGCTKETPKNTASWETVSTFTEEEIELMAKMEHRRWMAERLLGGWRKGSPKDVENKIHPDLKKWNALSKEVRAYNREMVQSIPRLLALVGDKIYRKRA